MRLSNMGWVGLATVLTLARRARPASDDHVASLSHPRALRQEPFDHRPR